MRFLTLIAIGICLSINVFAQKEDDLGWPRVIEKKGYNVTFYQPQLESFEDNILEGRMAVSVRKKDGQPVFGAAWFKTRVKTDYDTRLVSFEDLTFTDSKFPEIDEEDYKGLKDLILKEIGKWGLVMSMDRFLVSLDGIKSVDEGLDDSQYNNTPPVIYFRKEPAVLIMIDGGPTLKPTDETNLMSVVNTPYFVLLDTKKSKYYLTGGEWWWESEKVESGWEQIKKPPKNVKNYYDKQKVASNTELDSAAMNMEKPPGVIVSTEPAELIMSDGEPEFKSVEGTELLYLSNSESDVLMHIKSQQYYVLIAGRWFRAGSLESKSWTFVNPYKLPEDFQNIPEDSEIANVRVSIPETPESKDAILETSIPQTAEIDRATATVMVKYDGDPKFEQIEGTEVYYAINTDKDVLMFNKTYYCVDDAVWFISSAPKGPWSVADSIPDEIYDIPASSPLHNVTYVYIYESTPEVVYVGYTPGYYGSYVSHGVIIYGTGYYYQPWYGRYYYPRSVTYGYGVHYNPYTGWGFSVGISYGWVRYGGYGGYWGRGGYRYGYRHGYAHGVH
ncbi:MAG: carbohydrate-binding family V/XII, partial [Saprospiraceae bacterium]|nr:carbohydrate-binding family V/XII [Saprospiraceae bacterium]